MLHTALKVEDAHLSQPGKSLEVKDMQPLTSDQEN
jgi:hypothetical protein